MLNKRRAARILLISRFKLSSTSRDYFVKIIQYLIESLLSLHSFGLCRAKTVLVVFFSFQKSQMAPKAIRKSSNTDQVQLQVPPKCYLDRLPLEILAEVLLNTASPRDILAVARCSKFLCVTLVNNPATVYIWKLLRQKFHSIPDPTPNWTESSYAVFLFDDSNCEVRFRLLCSRFTS